MLAPGMISLLTQTSLRERLIGSSVIDEHENITAVGSISRKIKAAKGDGFKTFLVSVDQTAEESIDTSGIQIIPVSEIKQACMVFCKSSSALAGNGEVMTPPKSPIKPIERPRRGKKQGYFQ